MKLIVGVFFDKTQGTLEGFKKAFQWGLKRFNDKSILASAAKQVRLDRSSLIFKIKSDLTSAKKKLNSIETSFFIFYRFFQVLKG